MLAVAGVLLVLSVIIAVTVPQFLMRTGETLTKDFIVEANVRSLQTGIEIVRGGPRRRVSGRPEK